MIRILDRMIAGTFLKIFLVFVLGAPGLFILGDITEKLDRYLDQGLTMGDIALGYLYQMPLWIFVWAFPIAALIACVFTVQNMTVHREIVAAKAGGISFHRLVLPLFILGAILTGTGLYMSDVVPEANKRAGQIFRSEDPRREWRSDFVYQADDGRTLSVRRLTVDDGRLLGVVIEREGTDSVPTRHVTAEEAVWDSVQGWTLENGYFRQFTRDGQETAFQFDALQSRDFTERPDELTETPPHEDELTYGQMGRLIRIVEGSGGDANRLRVLREQKLAIPVTTLVIILFGAPLATSAKRGGAAYGIGVALASAILYISLFKVAVAAGSSGAVDPLLAAWTPNGVFLLAGLFLLARVRT